MKKSDRIFLRDLLSEVSLNGTVARLDTTQRQQADRLSQEIMQPVCTCSDCGAEMTRVVGPLAPGGPIGESWDCPNGHPSRMWPDATP
jgi:hypothetical protein